MTIVEVTPKLSIAPQITNSINFSRTIASSYFELDSFLRINHFTRHHIYIDGANTIEMTPNDGTNDNEEDTLITNVTNQWGFTLFLPTTLLFTQRFHFITPNDLVLCTSYVNKIAKLVSLDQSLMKLIFTFNDTPDVNGTKYTLGNLVLNVVAGTPDLVGDVLTVTPDGSDDICVTVSVVDYTETFNSEGFGFNNLVSGKYMPKVTALTGSDTHIVLKLRWLKADFSSYVDSWVVLQNLGETPITGSFYLTGWQMPAWSLSTNLYIGPEGNDKTHFARFNCITYSQVKGGDTIVCLSFAFNQRGWARMTDYTMDSTENTFSYSLIPINSNLLWYGNEIFLVHYGEVRLSDNTLLDECYTHAHASMDNRVVEMTLCRTRKLEAVVYQVYGGTCSWSVCGSTDPGNFNDPCRRNNAGVWENRNLGPPWTRITGDFRGIGTNTPAQNFARSVAYVNVKSNLSFDFESCERVNVEYLVEPILPVTLYVNDYVHHTQIAVHGSSAEYGATLEGLLEAIPAITNYVYDHGALILSDVLGATYYATPHRYILAYGAGYHIVDLEGLACPRELCLYVNGYAVGAGARDGWTKVGGIPYIFAKDYPINYIWSDVDADHTGDFSFEDMPLGKPTTVEVSLYCKRQVGSETITVNVWDGTGWTNEGNITPDAAWAWKTIDISTTLNTRTKVTAAKIWLQHNA